MSSLLPGFEYDIFISYRHNDNRSGWVTEFVKNLQEELATTIKDPVSVYYDSNPHDGLLETHNVDKSLEGKLKCLIFIPILSHTYCDPKSFAWNNEFLVFCKLAKEDPLGLDVRLANKNVASRILPVQIHDLNPEDHAFFEKELGRVLRSIAFIFNSKGVNRPLTPLDSRSDNTNRTLYRDQINKVANAIEEIIYVLQHPDVFPLKKEKKTHNEIFKIHSTKSLWSELNRRNVIRAALVYLIAALATQQVAISLPSLFYLPDFSGTITWLLIILFPVAMTMAWLYEISPHGIIRTTSQYASQNPYPPNQKKPLTGVFSVTFLILLVSILLYYNRTKVDPKNDKSIALMPFINLSGDKEQEYFSVGMMQEIINQLVKIRELNVVSLQSSMNYQDSKKSFKNIATELHVANILEGTVQRSGDKVRIAVRLIDAHRDKNIWSQIFVRDISDVFSIQADVSQNIAKELQAVLSLEDEENLRVIPTSSRDAYDFYLKSLYYERVDDWINGIKMCDKAIELDPKFTLAYVLRSRWNGTHFFNKWVSWEGRDKLAMTDMLKALELNPDLAEVKICKAFTLYYTERKYDAAIQILKELQNDRPNDTQVFYWLGLIQRRQGLWWDALSNMEYAVSKDPGNTEFLIQTAYLHMVLHNYAEAIEYSNKALSINSDIGTARLIIYNSLLAWKGDIQEANRTIVHNARNNELESISDSMRMEWARHYYNRQFGELLAQIDQSKDELFEDQNYFEPRSLRYAQIHYLMGNQVLCRKYADQAITLLNNKIENTESDYRINTALGYVYAYKGEFDKAIEFAKKASELMPLSLDPFSDGITTEQSLATTYILVGKYDLAMDILEKLLSIPGNISVQILKLDPIYDKLRSLPRFEKIIHTNYTVKY